MRLVHIFLIMLPFSVASCERANEPPKKNYSEMAEKYLHDNEFEAKGLKSYSLVGKKVAIVYFEDENRQSLLSGQPIVVIDRNMDTVILVHLNQ